MRHFFRSLIALAYLLAATPAPAGFVINPFQFGAAAASISFVSCTADTSNSTTYTFSSHATGTAGTRKTIVGVSGLDAATSFSVSSMTVGGAAAAESVDNSVDTGSLIQTAIYIIDNPSGTTATIAVTFSEAITSASVCVWAAYDIISETPVDTANQFQTASANIDLSLDVSAGGVAVGMSAQNHTNLFGAWAGMTERSFAVVENATNPEDHSQSSADTTTTGTPLTVGKDFTETADSAGTSASFR